MVTRANRNRKLGGRSWVYFAQLGEGGPVKIGQTRQLGPRIKALQTGHPEKITLLGTIPETDLTEADCHAMFAKSRIRGEWFEPTPKLLALAEAGRVVYHDGFHGIIPDERYDAFSVIFHAKPCPQFERKRTGEAA